jgi:hypothetical protein
LTNKTEIAKRLAPHPQAMSLIPSESYSFPDHFSSTVTPSRRPKEEKTVKADAPRKKPTIVALPNPTPEPAPMLAEEESQFFAEEQPIEPVRPAVEPFRPKQPPPVDPVRSKPAPPNPAMLRATAPPPRIPDAPVRKMPFPPTLKPKVRWNNRAPAMDPAPVRQNGVNESALAPAPNVIPMKPAKVAPPPRPIPTPVAAQNPPPAPPPHSVRPAPAMREPIQAPPPPNRVPAVADRRPVQTKPVMQKPATATVPNPQTDFFEMFAEGGHEAAMKRRQQMKFCRFIACECAALAVLLPLVVLGLTLDITAPALRWVMNICTIAAAISAAVIPIVFYAFTPTLPELER